MKRIRQVLVTLLAICIVFTSAPPVLVAAASSTPCYKAMVITENQTIHSLTTSKDIYVAQGATLTLTGAVQINANVYVFGTLNNYSALTISGTLNCLHYGTALSAGNYDYGYFTTTRGATIINLNVTDSYLNAGIPTLSHMEVWETINRAACTESGLQQKRCISCNEKSDSATIPAKGHTYKDNWITISWATCKESGRKVRHCTDCWQEESAIIPMSAHAPGNWEVTKKATCTSTGTKIQKCTTCSKVLNSQTTPKTGHSFGKWATVKKATIFKTGTQKRTCSQCKKAETRTTKKLSSKVTLKKTKLSLKKKQTYTLKIKTFTTGDKLVNWSSTNTKVATVNKKTGKIKALKKGTAYIIVKMKSGSTSKCKVTIK